VIRRDGKLRMKFLIELEEKEQQWIGCVKRMDRTRILRRIELSYKGRGIGDDPDRDGFRAVESIKEQRKGQE
jgi:hypothetical protein